MKKIVALLLAAMLLMSFGALASDLPIMPEMVSLTLGMDGNASTGDPEDLWFWEFCRQAMNIDFDVDVTLEKANYVSLIFASDNVPDVLLAGLSTSDIVRYGMEEGMLLDFTPYLNEEYMPYLSAMLDEHPEWREQLKTPDGAIYSLPKIADYSTITGLNMVGMRGQYFINTVWMEELGLEMPKTLDDLYDVLSAFKEAYPESIPLGGSYASDHSPGYLLLNALGYTGTDNFGFMVSLREGEVVFPFGDREVFPEYLKILNQYYEEGLIDTEFFTADTTSVNAKLAEGRVGLMPSSISGGLKEGSNFMDYWGFTPLTSEFKAEPSWGRRSEGISIGNCSISAKCANVEAAVRWADWFYKPDSTNSLLAWIGPTADQTDILYGKTTGYDFDTAAGARVYRDVTNGKWGTVGELVQGEVAGFTERFGYVGHKTYAGFALSGNEDLYVELVYDETNSAQPWMWELYSMQENLMPYGTADYPSIVFLSEEENVAVADLKVQLENYATQEIAKFVTGARDLSEDELDAYFDTLDSMGFQEYLGYYANYYENVKG